MLGVALVVVGGCGCRVDVCGCWSMAMDVGLVVQTACHRFASCFCYFARLRGRHGEAAVIPAVQSFMKMCRKITRDESLLVFLSQDRVTKVESEPLQLYTWSNLVQNWYSLVETKIISRELASWWRSKVNAQMTCC